MRQFNAWVAVGATLLALISAPLFHAHDHDELGHSELVVHAHFAASEHASEYSESDVENSDEHEQARWIDVFTLELPNPAVQALAETPERIPLLALESTDDVVSEQPSRSHDPPDGRLSNPRSPPAL